MILEEFYEFTYTENEYDDYPYVPDEFILFGILEQFTGEVFQIL